MFLCVLLSPHEADPGSFRIWFHPDPDPDPASILGWMQGTGQLTDPESIKTLVGFGPEPWWCPTWTLCRPPVLPVVSGPFNPVDLPRAHPLHAQWAAISACFDMHRLRLVPDTHVYWSPDRAHQDGGGGPAGDHPGPDKTT